MKRDKVLMIVAVFGVLSMMVSVPIRQAYAAQAFVAPSIFQAAGPTAVSIIGVVADFRAALGDDNGSGGLLLPSADGRREINWDGGGVSTTDTTTGAVLDYVP